MSAPANGFQAPLILAVDDDDISRRLMEMALRPAGYELVLADGVEQAQEMFRQRGAAAFQAVITDYSLGERTGVELISWIKSMDASLAAIIVTAGQEKRLVEESLREGACGFLNKPLDVPGLRAAAAKAVELTRRHRHFLATETSVRQVARTQQAMLGAGLAQGPLPIELCYHPIHEAGGDFVCRFQLAHDRWLVLSTDVSGHDLNAAFVSAFFQGMVRGMVERGASMSEIFACFNRYLLQEWNPRQAAHGRLDVSTSVAACSILLDLRTGTGTVLTAGIPAPFHINSAGEVQAFGDGSAGPPLGWFEEIALETVERPLDPAGCCYFWTDGLEDLAARLGACRFAVADALLTAQAEGRRLELLGAAADDVMVARIARASAPAWAEAPRPIFFETYDHGDAGRLNDLQECWRVSLLVALPLLREEELYNLLLCLREGVLNAVKYGCAGGGRATVEIVRRTAQHELKVRIVDPGPGHQFDFEAHSRAADDALIDEHRGLMLMKQMASSMRSERNGATLILGFTLNPESFKT